MGLFVVNTQLGQQIEDHVRFHLEFARQLVNANFTHNGMPGKLIKIAGIWMPHLSLYPQLLRHFRICYRNRFIFQSRCACLRRCVRIRYRVRFSRGVRRS